MSIKSDIEYDEFLEKKREKRDEYLVVLNKWIVDNFVETEKNRPINVNKLIAIAKKQKFGLSDFFIQKAFMKKFKYEYMGTGALIYAEPKNPDLIKEDRQQGFESKIKQCKKWMTKNFERVETIEESISMNLLKKISDQYSPKFTNTMLNRALEDFKIKVVKTPKVNYVHLKFVGSESVLKRVSKRLTP